MTDEIVFELQKARLMAYLRHWAELTGPHDPDALVLIGFAVGLRLAAAYPEVAAQMLAELAPPPMSSTLSWVVYGSTRPDPDAPVN